MTSNPHRPLLDKISMYFADAQRALDLPQHENFVGVRFSEEQTELIAYALEALRAASNRLSYRVGPIQSRLSGRSRMHEPGREVAIDLCPLERGMINAALCLAAELEPMRAQQFLAARKRMGDAIQWASQPTAA